MFCTNPVSLCLYFSVRCCARQNKNELFRRKRVLNKLGAVSLKDCDYNFQSVKSFATMRDYNNGTVKNGNIQEHNADNNNSQVCNGR